MIHVGGRAFSFYSPWLLPEQACIEATHVACLVAGCIHIGSCKKKPEALQKQSRPEQKLRAAGCQQGTPVVAWQWPCFMVYAGCVKTCTLTKRTLKQTWSNIHMVLNRSYCENNKVWKKHQHIFSTRIFSINCQGLTPKKSLHKRKQTNCIQNGKTIPHKTIT